MRRCVLVVDDDPLIRKVSARVLEGADFDVAVAGGSMEALGPIGTRHFEAAPRAADTATAEEAGAADDFGEP